MPLIHIKSAVLSTEQKKRIGDRIIDAFHAEGIPAGSVVVLFGRADTDILLDGVLFEAEVPARVEALAPAPLSRPLPAPPPEAPPAPEPEPALDFKSRLRRTKGELNALKAQLVKLLQAQGALSSFQAQDELGLKTCDWAPATLRRFFSELEEEGAIVKQGQKRGTRYVWKGISSQSGHSAPRARLVKRGGEEPAPAE